MKLAQTMHWVLNVSEVNGLGNRILNPQLGGGGNAVKLSLIRAENIA